MGWWQNLEIFHKEQVWCLRLMEEGNGNTFIFQNFLVLKREIMERKIGCEEGGEREREINKLRKIEDTE